MRLEEAVNLTKEFLEDSGYYSAKLISIKKVKENWIVIYDTGSFGVEKKQVTISDINEEIIGYEPI